MAKGKNLIWTGPADGANNKPLNVEGEAAAAILPGTLLVQTATTLAASTSAATVFGERMLVADKDQMRSELITKPWTIAENMVGIHPRSGETMNVLCVTGQALVQGVTPLTRNGAGLLRIALTNGTEEIMCFADETVTTTATQLVAVAVE